MSVDFLVWGEEPKFEKIDSLSDIRLVGIFNWYNYHSDKAKERQYIVEYLKSNNQTDLLAQLDNMTDFGLKNWVSSLCRQASIGCEIHPDIKKLILNEIAISCEQYVKPKSESKPASTKNRNAINEAIGDIETVIDEFLRRNQRYYTPNIMPILQKHNAASIAAMSEYYGGILQFGIETNSANDYIRFIRALLDQIHSRLNTAPRRTRKKKIIPPIKLVKNLKFAPTFEMFKSEDPVNIVGAQQVWLYNFKYNRLTKLNAGTEPLSVNGTTVINYDETASIAKIVKVKELAKIVNAGKVELRKIMDTFKTKPIPAAGRCSADTIILRTVK